jgi:hypothetical protein
MRRPDGTSWNNKRPAGVARSFQVSEYGVEAEFNMAINVFANDPSRLEFSYESIHFWPKVSWIGLPALPPGDAEWLAGIAPAYDVDVADVVILKSPYR